MGFFRKSDKLLNQRVIINMNQYMPFIILLLWTGCVSQTDNYSVIELNDMGAIAPFMKSYPTLKIADIEDGKLKVLLKWPKTDDNNCPVFIIGIKTNEKPAGLGDESSSKAHMKYNFHGTFLFGERNGEDKLFFGREHFDTFELEYCNWLADKGFDGFIINLKEEDKKMIKEHLKSGNIYLLELELTEYPSNELSFWIHF